METENISPKYHMGYIWTVCLVAAMGGLLFGYDWVVIGGAKPFYEKFFNLTSSSQVGWAMSSALIGCLAGAVLSGGLSDRFGRKRLLILAAILFTITSVGTAMAGSFTMFIFCRLCGGVGIGLASNLSPMYIAEVSPAKIRGMFVSINQLTIVIGVLSAQLINWLIARPVPAGATALDILNSWNGQTGWRWMFGATAVPALLFFVFMFLVPESPRWLAKNGKDLKAKRILSRIGGEPYSIQAFAEIKETLVNEVAGVNFRDLFAPRMMKVLWIGVVLAVFQQWCGINVIFNYAEEIFSAAGYNISGILLNIVITGAVMLVFTFVAIFTVDRLGRKPLMLAGSAGLALTYILIGASYHAGIKGALVLILVVAAIACYSFSLAPITWVILSEIFPNRIRGAAMSVSVFALWFGCFTLTYTFPLLHRNLGPAYTFWIYALICVAGFFFVKSHLPETKGKSLEEIEKELTD